MPAVIALVGDRDESVTAHRAIDACVARADPPVTARWVASPDAAQAAVEADGIWCVPASPYADTGSVLAAITHARVAGVPFLGTCGGYQHAIIEFARGVMGESDATSAELDPSAVDPLIVPLGCALRDTADRVLPEPGTRLAAIWGLGPHEPEYNCGFGVNPTRVDALVAAGLRVSARDDAGEPRGIELPGHAFFTGVAFQPERDALSGTLSPIVHAFFAAAGTRASV